jgi:hypothetical protein
VLRSLVSNPIAAIKARVGPSALAYAVFGVGVLGAIASTMAAAAPYSSPPVESTVKCHYEFRGLTLRLTPAGSAKLALAAEGIPLKIGRCW